MSSKPQERRKSTNGADKIPQIIPLSPESISHEDLDQSFEGLPTPVLRNGSMRAAEFGNSVKSLPLIVVQDRAWMTAVAHPRNQPDPHQKKLDAMVDVPVFLHDEEASLDLCFHESSSSLSLNDTSPDAQHSLVTKMTMSTPNLNVDDTTLRAPLRKSKRQPSIERIRKLRSFESGTDSQTSHIRNQHTDLKMHSSTPTLSMDETSLRSLRKMAERAGVKPSPKGRSKKVVPDSKKKLSRSKSKQNLSAVEKTPSGTSGKLSRANSLSNISTDSTTLKRMKSESSINLDKGVNDGFNRTGRLGLGRALSTSKLTFSDLISNKDANVVDEKKSKDIGGEIHSERSTKRESGAPSQKSPKSKGREKLSRAASLPRLLAEKLMRKETESEKSHKWEAGVVRRSMERAACLSKTVSERILVKSDSKRKVHKASSEPDNQLDRMVTPKASKSLRKLGNSLSDLKLGELVKSSESKKKHLTRAESSRSLKKSKSRRNLERQPSKSHLGGELAADSVGDREIYLSLPSPVPSMASPKVGQRSPRGRTRPTKSRQGLHDESPAQTPRKPDSKEQDSVHPRGARPPPSKSPGRPPSRSSSGEFGKSIIARSTLRSQSPSRKLIDRTRLIAHPSSSPSISPKKASPKKSSYLQLKLPHSSSSQDLSSLAKNSASYPALDKPVNEHRLLSSKLHSLQLAEPFQSNGDVYLLHASNHCSTAVSVSDATLKVSNSASQNVWCKEESDCYSQSLSVESPFSGGGGGAITA